MSESYIGSFLHPIAMQRKKLNVFTILNVCRVKSQGFFFLFFSYFWFFAEWNIYEGLWVVSSISLQKDSSVVSIVFMQVKKNKKKTNRPSVLVSTLATVYSHFPADFFPIPPGLGERDKHSEWPSTSCRVISECFNICVVNSQVPVL